MIALNKDTKTLICIGTGGVGKTTIAASVAVGCAAQGLKVLVLTIDPSQRLAQALGIQPDGEIYRVTENLNACTLNHEKIFKDFILKASEKTMYDEDVNRLLQNKLYKQLSTQLSGSQEFTSLFRLNQFVKSQEYDLVILDTPPAQHTWNFLYAPEKIAQLFNEGVSQWFRDPEQKQVGFFKKFVNLGTTQVLRALEMLTGSEFIKELALFFKAVQKWQEPLERQVWDCHKLLTSKQTEFVLVTALDPSRVNEALKLSTEINKQGYNLTSIVINRVPAWLGHDLYLQKGLVYDYKNYLKNLETQLVNSKTQFGSNLKVYKSFELSQNQLHVNELKKIYNQIQPV